MATALSDRAKEQSTIIITVSFADETGKAVTPTSVTWSLTDTSEAIINSRDDESITPGTSVDIVLSGDDLTLASTEKIAGKRWLIVKAIYNSDYGTGLYMKDSAVFYIDNLKDV